MKNKIAGFSWFAFSVIIIIFIPRMLCARELMLQDTIAKKDSVAYRRQVGEVTISAFYTPYNRINIPGPVNYINEQQLQAGDALTPVETINRVPGIIMQSGAINTNRLTIRGIGSRTPYTTSKIKAYFGDIPLTSGDGETTLEDLENGAIGRIEIIKGPSSSLYGAGLGGTVLFYPKTVSSDFIQQQSTVASFNTLKNITTAGLGQKNLDIFALYSDLKSGGYRDNNQTDRQNVMMNTEIRRDKNVSGSLLLKWTRMNALIPSSLDLNTYKNSPQSAAANWLAIKGHEDYTTGQGGGTIKIKTQQNSNYKVAFFAQFRNSDELRPFNRLKEASHFAGSRGSYQKKFEFNEWKFNLVAGYEIFRETYNWQTISNTDNTSLLSDNHEKRKYENIFFQAEFNRNSRLIISTGANLNDTRYIYTDLFLSDGDQSGRYTYNPVVSQRLGFNFKLAEAWAWFGNMSQGFSPPTLQETLLPEGSINPDIKPETGWNLETGIRGSLGDRFSMEVSYYRIYISNLLVARRTGADSYVGVNAGHSLNPGLEASFQWVITPPGTFPFWEVTGNTTLANYHFTDFVDNGNDYSGNNLPGTTKTTGFISMAFSPVKNVNLTLSNRFVGKMPADDANNVYSDAFDLTDIELEYPAHFGKIVLKVKTGINNLLDSRYASMLAINALSSGGSPPRYYYPGDPRNVFVSIALSFNP